MANKTDHNLSRSKHGHLSAGVKPDPVKGPMPQHRRLALGLADGQTDPYGSGSVPKKPTARDAW